jgi:beta-1,4-mannosyl-glycoprotein beta-1,4-N-acetylglucosaminyltransferase
MEYYDVVDYFVLVESTTSHTGKTKPLYYQESKDRFKEYSDKIIHVAVKDSLISTPTNTWAAEYFQRECILRGLEGVADRLDRIFISDCDELWDTETAKKYSNIEKLTFQQDLYYYYVNCKQNCTWNGTMALPYELLKINGVQRVRDASRCGKHDVKYPGGWHYSFMGSAAKIREKVENISESHVIIDKVGSVEEIQTKMVTGQDLWNRTEDYAKKQFVPLLYTPKKLPEFLMLYPDFYRKP